MEASGGDFGFVGVFGHSEGEWPCCACSRAGTPERLVEK